MNQNVPNCNRKLICKLILCGRYETWVYTLLTLHFRHWNLVVILCLFTETTWDKHYPATDQYPTCQNFKMSHLKASVFGFLLGLDWGWISLALISNKFWTEVRIFAFLFLYHRMLEWYKYSVWLYPTGKKIIPLSVSVFWG